VMPGVHLVASEWLGASISCASAWADAAAATRSFD